MTADELSLTDRLRDRILVGDEILNLPAPELLVGEGPTDIPVLERDTLAVLFGRTGLGKTFVATSLAIAVARGDAWHGRPVTSSAVLYVIAEGARGLVPRIGAHLRYHELDAVGPVSWLPGAVSLLDRPTVAALREVVTELDVGLVVVDTLARCTAGGDENSAKDTGLVVDALDRLRTATGACMLVVHHTGKDETAGARGSSALKGAADTELELTGDAQHLVLRATKHRNAPSGTIGRYRLAPFDNSVVLAPGNGDTSVSARDVAILEALHEIDPGTGMATTAWHDATDGMAVRTFYRGRKQVLDDDLAANVGTEARPRYSLTDKGREVIHCRAATPLPPTATAQGHLLPATTPSLGGGSGSDQANDKELFDGT